MWRIVGKRKRQDNMKNLRGGAVHPQEGTHNTHARVEPHAIDFDVVAEGDLVP